MKAPFTIEQRITEVWLRLQHARETHNVVLAAACRKRIDELLEELGARA